MKQKNTVGEKPRAPSRFQGLQLLLVQSSVCVLAVVIVLMLRVLGVDVYSEFCSLFEQAMTRDVLVSASAEMTAHSDMVTAGVFEPDSASCIAAGTEAQRFVAPLHGAVLTSSFGERDDPFGTGEVTVHRGMDLAAPEGTPVSALADGRVKLVEYEENGFGHYVVITCDNGFRYLYAHCSAIYAKPGQSVKAGETVAAVGNSGRSTGPHVHIEWIAADGTKLDPSAVIPREAYD